MKNVRVKDKRSNERFVARYFKLSVDQKRIGALGLLIRDCSIRRDNVHGEDEFVFALI